MNRWCLYYAVILCLFQIETITCRGGRSFGRSFGRGSSRGYSFSRPAFRPAYRPLVHIPSIPSYQPPPPVFRPPSYSIYHPPVHIPSPPRDTGVAHFGNRPTGFFNPANNKAFGSSSPIGPPTQTKPLNNAPTFIGSSSNSQSGHIGFVDPSNSKPLSPNIPKIPVEPPVQTKPLNNAAGGSSSSQSGHIRFVDPSNHKPLSPNVPTIPVESPVQTKPLNNAAGGSSSSQGGHIGFVDPSNRKPLSPNIPKIPVEPPVQTKPLNNAAGGTSSSVSGHIGFVDPSNRKPLSPNVPTIPVGPPVQTKPLNDAAGGSHYVDKPPPYNPHYNPPTVRNPAGYGPPPAYNPAGYGPPPAYNPTRNIVGGSGPPPAYNPAHNGGGYGPPPAYNPAHNNAGGFAPPPPYSPPYHFGSSYHPQNTYHPQGHPAGVTVINNNINNHHPGGYSSPQVHYTTSDTGSGTLGFFLGYSLGKLNTPSYHYYNRYDDYTPRYDHYEVHHYYHNNQNVPKEVTIEPNAIVTCYGDSGSICPANTRALCTNNGAVMCVASALSTVPCTNEIQANCVRSSIPCKDNNGTECKSSNNGQASVTIPCISTAKVYGNITYVNNTIIISNNTGNATANNSNKSNVAMSSTPSGTGNINGTVEKKEQAFCVTILALPAERQLTEGEQLFTNSKNIVSKFLTRTLGID